MSLKAEHIFYTYQKNTPFESEALHDVTVEIEKGSFTGIIGHTGCGKSTLVQHFNGLLRPEQGQVWVDGQLMTDKNVGELRKKVGLVFQYPEYQLFEETVFKDVAYGIRKEALSEEEKRIRVLEALDIVGMEASLAERSVYDLSGGQKRRVALAGIIVMNPDYLVLDEPAAGLDPVGRDEILRYLKRLQTERGTTIVLVSHSMEDIARLADYIYVLNDSRVALSGTVAEVFQNEDRLNEIGLAVPQITLLWNRLRNRFPTLPRDVYTVEAALQAVSDYMGGRVK
jgi:energy-coupling factor transport system ATP-binding protein